MKEQKEWNKMQKKVKKEDVKGEDGDEAEVEMKTRMDELKCSTQATSLNNLGNTMVPVARPWRFQKSLESKRDLAVFPPSVIRSNRA